MTAYHLDTDEWRVRIMTERQTAYAGWERIGVSETTAGCWFDGKLHSGTVFVYPPATVLMATAGIGGA